MPRLMLIEVMQLIYICLEANCTVVDVFVVSVKTNTILNICVFTVTQTCLISGNNHMRGTVSQTPQI